MKKLFKRNYDAVVNRGLITENTTDVDFLEKLKEETIETSNEVYSKRMFNDNNPDLLHQEIADCLTVCANWLIFNKVDLTEILTQIAEKNEKRSIKT